MPVAKLSIRRGGVAEEPHRDVFEIGFEPGESVLDALRRLRATQDATLAFRYACINANACKECMMLLDGKVIYACTARLEPREMRLDPLANKPLLRDLATQIAPPDERLE
ncbi:2Fe-2S iron-sulfur cluster-binding protein [Roseococcus sp. YIM B11640]|uniref:2Fe-2S iron-sulfur cluster-binding protein n=1 Tax=Roseococcus sp. YIM B11640 TaxID=3133973 RepID=UPI003C79AB07